MTKEVLMPQLGQAMVTGVITEWHVADGAHVCAGAPLVTIEADKAAFDIEAPADGVVRHQLPAGAEAEVGTVIAMIGASAAAADTSSPSMPAAAGTRRAAAAAPASPVAARVLASPRARAAAAGRIDLADVSPTSADGMITTADVEQAIADRLRSAPPREPARGERREALGTLRRGAIHRLQKSWSQAPHFVQIVDTDATQLVAARSLRQAGGTRATLNDIIIKAAADTMAEFADLNAHVEGDEIVYADQVDVSLAVATDRGLRTPVIRDAAGLSLDELAVRTRAAVEDARAGRAAGGRSSLTVSNLGGYGIRCGTPVLNLDESVLVFVGEIAERAVVRSGAIAARHEMTLSIAFDHRVVDGLRAAEFSAALRRRLESPVIADAAPGGGRS